MICMFFGTTEDMSHPLLRPFHFGETIQGIFFGTKRSLSHPLFAAIEKSISAMREIGETR